MLNDDLKEILHIFNKFDISEEDQRRIFSKGIYFDFTYGNPDPKHRNKKLDVFGVWILLKTCVDYNININLKTLLHEPWAFEEESLVRFASEMQDRYNGVNEKKGQKIKHN